MNRASAIRKRQYATGAVTMRCISPSLPYRPSDGRGGLAQHGGRGVAAAASRSVELVVEHVVLRRVGTRLDLGDHVRRHTDELGVGGLDVRGLSSRRDYSASELFRTEMLKVIRADISLHLNRITPAPA